MAGRVLISSVFSVPRNARHRSSINANNPSGESPVTTSHSRHNSLIPGTLPLSSSDIDMADIILPRFF
jgi:hypothetical protein